MSNILKSFLISILFVVSVKSRIRMDPYYYIQPCDNNVATIDNCLLHLINNFVKQVNEGGVPNLNLTKAEPLHLEPIEHTMNWALQQYHINFTEIVASGASAITVKRVRSNTTKLRFEADFFIPHLQVNSTFRTVHYFFGLTPPGGGEFYGIFDNVNSYITFHAKAINRDGEVYLQLNEDDFNLDYTMQFIQMRVDKVFSGNLLMQAAFNFFLSINSQGVVNDAKPSMMPAFRKKLIQILSYILANIPLRKFVEAYYVRPCENNQTTLDNCLVNTGNNFFGQINKLIPRLHLKRPDPYTIDSLTANLTMGPFAKYKLNFTDVVTTGFSDLRFTRIRMNVEKLKFEGDLHIPHVSTKAKYNSLGKIFWATVPRDGEFYGEFDNVNCYVYFNATAVPKNGIVFLKLQGISLDFTVQSQQLRIDRVTYANSILQRAFNAYLSINGHNVIRELYPILTQMFTERVADSLKFLFEKVPLDQLIKDSKYFR